MWFETIFGVTFDVLNVILGHSVTLSVAISHSLHSPDVDVNADANVGLFAGSVSEGHSISDVRRRKFLTLGACAC